ncbi:MAG: hypothetical protein FVQ81_08125 [Candidatus Glassbacteria bacterium]|nr:hypothetical protein [Candidatus Glassbacteria bacterium]
MKTSRIFFTLAAVALVLGLATDGLALQSRDRISQGNNFGLHMRLGSTVFAGTSEYPRGSGNIIPTFEGGWGHFLAVARDIDGDGYAEDTLYGRSRGRTVGGRRGTLESMDLVLEGVAAGHRMDQWMSRVENNEVWSSLDPDNLARWPAEFRDGHSAGGEPIMFGRETMGAMHSDAWNISYHRSVPPTGVSLEYQFYFLDFGESNDLAFGHLFIRNMSEYLKYNNNSDFVAQVASTPDGQVWDSFALMYVENYFGIGFSTVSMDEGWAFHPARVIKCMVDQNGLESGFTNGGMAFIIGYTPLKNMEFNGDTTYLSNTTNFRWSADFGISTAQDMGTRSDPGHTFRWATCLQPDGSERDISDFYGDEISPYTGRRLSGNPGVIVPSDDRYNQWLWGRQGRINYHAWSGLHQFGPRDTTFTDFAIMAAYPTNPPLVMLPNDIANIDDPNMQVQLVPLERMQDVAQIVYGGAYILPQTPIPPPMTVVPGDRQVTITWSNVNLNTPDQYYYFIQENPEVDPNGVYREYDFEGFRLYRSYVGPSDAHAEMLWEGSIGGGNLGFSYLDTSEKDDPYYRLRNGIKVWYALVPFDRNNDPATGESFSLPDPDQSKTWNRTFPPNYFTVRPRSDASNFRPAEVKSFSYNGSGGSVTASDLPEVTLTGADGVLTQAPVYLTPKLTDVVVVPVLDEKMTSDFTTFLAITDMGPNGERAGRRTAALVDESGNLASGEKQFIVRHYGDWSDGKVSFAGDMSADGATYEVQGTFDSRYRRGAGTFQVQLDVSGASGSDIQIMGGTWGFDTRGTVYNTNGTWHAFTRTGRYEISLQASGSSVSVSSVNETVRGASLGFTPYLDEEGWGFVPTDLSPRDITQDMGATYPGYKNVEPPQSTRSLLLVQSVDTDGVEEINLYVGGVFLNFSSITAVPSGAMTLITAYGDWNDDDDEFTQQPGPAFLGDKWKIEVKGSTMNLEDIELSKIRVVPNPYIATSMLDQSGGNRRIDFVNLPDRCTIRIYSLGGNLVNVLNHIGSGRTGWGNFTDLDNIQPDNTPLVFTGYDNHSGTEAWNMKNRFGQTVASGLYFYHVTDERGETHTGKFYIVN